jgi:hypothetical protein
MVASSSVLLVLGSSLMLVSAAIVIDAADRTDANIGYSLLWSWFEQLYHSRGYRLDWW